MRAPSRCCERKRTSMAQFSSFVSSPQPALRVEKAAGSWGARRPGLIALALAAEGFAGGLVIALVRVEAVGDADLLGIALQAFDRDRLERRRQLVLRGR